MITSQFYFIYLPWVQFLRAYPGLPADPVYPEERKLTYVLVSFSTQIRMSLSVIKNISR